MAIKKVKRPAHHTQPSIKAARRNDRQASSRHSQRGKPAERRIQTRSTHAPADFALHQRTLPHRRFVEFPLAKGKVTDKVQLFTTNCHSLTIDACHSFVSMACPRLPRRAVVATELHVLAHLP